MRQVDFVATKVYSRDCPACEHMSRYDRSVFEGFSSLRYQEADLDEVINNGGNPIKLRLYRLLEEHAVNNDYTVDVPVYLVTDIKGKYLGHHTGEASVKELREKIRLILEGD